MLNSLKFKDNTDVVKCLAMYEYILANVARHITLTEDEKAYFLSLVRQKNLSRKELVLKEGQLCRDINFVQSGTLRAFYLDKSGKDSTVMFAVTDWWITDMFCFVNHQEAMLNIEALEDSTVFQLAKKDLDTLFVEVPKFEKFFRVLMQNAYVREQLRVIQTLSLTAEERYNHFLAKYPQVVKQVTQKQIASYLGITPEFLSNIRRNKAKKTIS